MNDLEPRFFIRDTDHLLHGHTVDKYLRKIDHAPVASTDRQCIDMTRSSDGSPLAVIA